MSLWFYLLPKHSWCLLLHVTNRDGQLDSIFFNYTHLKQRKDKNKVAETNLHFV